MPLPDGHPSVDEFHRDPYAYFGALRRVNPVSWTEFFDGPAWVVSGFAEAAGIMKDRRFVREAPSEVRRPASERVRRAFEMKHRMILVRDAPFHTRVRALISKAFTPGLVAGRRPAIEAAANDLLDRALERGEFDLMADFARPLPLYVVCDLIGVPAADRDRAVAWSQALLTFIDFHSSDADLEAASGAMLEAREYFTHLIDARRRAPADDLVSSLLAEGAASGAVSDDEIVASCVVLISAGHETTMNLIGNGYWLLLRHPEQLRRARAGPSPMSDAVEEILRYESPVLTTSRWVSADLCVGGQTMRKGQFVILGIGGCNRDPRAFADPDRFDVSRSPVRHLSFGSGVHFCVGAALARLEGRIALQTLVSRLGESVIAAEPRWASSVALRGFDTLRIRAVGAARPAVRGR
ncbi:MAG: cytochrome P450 [Vicinamibacterales bacterium]